MDAGGSEDKRGSLLAAALVPCAVIVGIVFRIWMLASPIGMLDSDEAVVGLMARHMLEGEFPVFFWGQPYGGPHEAALAAGVFWVTGSSVIALKLVPAALSAVAAVLTWRVGRRTVGEPAAAIGAALMWVWPMAFVWWSIKAVGFYQAGLVAALGVVLCALRLRERDSWIDAALLGVLAGTAWWATAQSVYLMAPALVWLVVSRPGVAKLAPAMLAGVLVGAGPWLVHNLQNDWVGLEAPATGFPGNTYLHHLKVFFTEALPRALGLRLPDGWLPPGGAQVAYGLLLALFVYAAVQLRGNARLLVVAGVAYPFLFAVSPFSWYVEHPRYLYFLAPVPALLIARGLTKMPVAAAVAAFATMLGLTAFALASVNAEARMIPPAPDIRSPLPVTPVVEYMEKEDVEAAWATYWLAYRLTFESGENVIVTPYSGVMRNAEYADYVRNHPSAAYVFLDESSMDDHFRAALEGMGVEFDRTSVEGFVVYRPHADIDPEAVPGLL
ncbi:MAG: glycosyltransferase family 39 protein [Actinomycetota bacterium]|nr:glycosyltransferase family 39 protein [Actinomycetota bacterium]